MLLSTCATGGQGANSKIVPLDEAIRTVAEHLENTLEPGAVIALLNFSSPSEAFSAYVLDELSDRLVNGRKLVVVDRAQLDLIRQEERFQLSGEVSDATAVSIGKKVGAQVIVSGSLTGIGQVFRVRVRALSVETAVIAASRSSDINSNEDRVRNLLGGRMPVVETAQSAPRPSSATTPQPNPSLIPTERIYRIGDVGPAGGIIFYDKGNNSGGWRYLEAAPAETDRVPLTFASFSSLAEINNRTLGAGLNNTRLYLEKLRNNNVTGNTAPWICDTLVHNGYSDWFLPSLDELLMIYTNLRNNRNAGFQSSAYWTSTCFSNGSSNPGAAYFVDFSNGQARIGSWSETFRVRAIRRF
jgi:TolB-like protein